MRPWVEWPELASGENPQQGQSAPGKGFSCTVQPAGQVTDRKCTPPVLEVQHSTTGLGASKDHNKQTNKQTNKPRLYEVSQQVGGFGRHINDDFRKNFES